MISPRLKDVLLSGGSFLLRDADPLQRLSLQRPVLADPFGCPPGVNLWNVKLL
jgi:hypothetical protein